VKIAIIPKNGTQWLSKIKGGQMLVTAKIKWFGSIILGGTLLVLALMGGNWGTNYIASASVDAAPIITSISPASVPAGSPDILLTIWGSNFGSMNDTRVRLTTGFGFDQLFSPAEIRQNRILVILPASLFVDPILYTLTVVKSTPGTIPTLPPTPYDEESNPVPFTVYETLYLYFPIMQNYAFR
jgi:hypothetical protein